MIGLLWYFATLLGAYIYILGSPLATVLSPIEAAFAAIPLGTIAAPWIVYIVAALMSNLGPQTMIIANLALLWIVGERFSAFWRMWRAQLAKGLGAADRSETLWVLGVVTALGVPFWFLYSSHMLPMENGKIMSGGSCWADLPIHMHIAEAFLLGRNQDISFGDMHSPVFAGEKMYYPFLPDFHAAVIKRLGGSLRDGFLVPGFLMASALWAFLFLLSVRVTRSRVGALLAIALTIGAGGMGGINLWMKNGWASAVHADSAQNDVSGDGRIFWFAFIPHILLPQRGANFAYPMVLLVLLLVWRATDAAARMSVAQRRSLLVHAAAFAATLPLVQAHAFIGVGMVVGVIALCDAHKWLADVRLLLAWGVAGVAALAIGGPQMAMFRGQVEHGAGGSFVKFGWIHLNHEIGRNDGFFYFWWMSLGPAVPLFLAALAINVLDVAYAAWLGWSLRKTDGPNGIERYLASAGKDAAGRVPPESSTTGHVHAAHPAQSTSTSNGEGADGVTASGGAAANDSSSSSSDGIRGAGAVPVGEGLSSSRSGGGGAGAPLLARSASATSGGSRASARHSGGGDDAIGSINPITGAPWEDPRVTLTGAAYLYIVDAVGQWLDDAVEGRRVLGFSTLQASLWHLNALSITGRALDSLALGLGALAVFLVGNYINFQPWDRDNCKLFYIWVFLSSMMIGATLAAPLEALLGLLPGSARMLQLTGASPRAVMDAALGTVRVPSMLSEPAARSGSSTAAVGDKRLVVLRGASFGGLAGGVIALFFLCCTGFMMVIREYAQFHVLMDEDQMAVAKYIIENIPPKAVFLHKDVHITPSGCLAGRPTLISYNGWMWSHGYNYYERDKDRQKILENALKDSDPETINLLKRWGVRYVQGEWLAKHHRPREQEYNAALARAKANPEEKVAIPPFDPDMYLDGGLKRVFSAGRYDILRVEGYSFQPT